MKKLLVATALLLCMNVFAHSNDNFVESDLFGELGARDKAAILIVHFGTSHNDTRALTIDALNTAMREAFPGIEIREAWTSRIIIRKLAREGGIEKQNPTQALIRLHEEGYTHILVQSSNIIEGTEMKELRREVESLSLNFKDIRIGNPLLYAPEDYATVTRCLTEAVRKSCPNGQMLFVGHGTPDPATASYAMLDYMLKSEGHADCHVATVEGYPAIGNALQLLKKNASRTVTLVPLMFVAGDHARNDIAGEDFVILMNDAAHVLDKFLHLLLEVRMKICLHAADHVIVLDKASTRSLFHNLKNHLTFAEAIEERCQTTHIHHKT